jgi:hypothetical protein
MELEEMTTVVCWKSADGGKRETLNLCADSRFGDGAGKNWDCGRKLFFSRVFPDVFGFVGEALPPQTALGQLVEAIDSSSLGTRPPDPAQRMAKYKSYLDATIGTFPKTRSVQILFATRDDRASSPTLHLWSIMFSSATGPGNTQKISTGGSKSGFIGVFGSGESNFREIYSDIHSKPQGTASRAVYWAFVDHLAAGVDKYTGGSPQIVRLRGAGAAFPVGISHNEKRYLFGFELDATQLEETKIEEWHDELYQFVNPVTGKLRSNAQRIARPK